MWPPPFPPAMRQQKLLHRPPFRGFIGGLPPPWMIPSVPNQFPRFTMFPVPNITINLTQNFYGNGSAPQAVSRDVYQAPEVPQDQSPAPMAREVYQAPEVPHDQSPAPMAVNHPVHDVNNSAPNHPVHDVNSSAPTYPGKRKRASNPKPRASQAKPKITYSNKGFSSLMSMTGVESVAGRRVVGRSRVWSSELESYGDWEIHSIKIEPSANEVVEFQMRGGGCIKFFGELVPAIDVVGKEMKEHFKSLKQYKVRECGDEPRLHALFTSTGSGYQYGRIQMEGNDLRSLPIISVVAKSLASKFNLRNHEWNIGCHLVLYRSGRDSINWHADDTQGEDTVASLTVDGPSGDARTICFQPAGSPQDGDKQLELFPVKGDVYTMDEAVQKFYVHAMMKTKEHNNNSSNQRMSIIFRSGQSKVCIDNGWHVNDFSPSQPKEYVFGNMSEVLEEGKCYSRNDLLKLNAHVARQGNIAGNQKVGCPSIIVKALSDTRDEDQYHFLTYVASDHSHPLTLLKSFLCAKPIRVFRSSNGNREKSNYFPSPNGNKVVYRYDGIYYVVATIDKKNDEIVGLGGVVVDARVFFLVRAEPCILMQQLITDHAFLDLFLPDMNANDESCFSARDSKQIVNESWNVKAFRDWNPLATKL